MTTTRPPLTCPTCRTELAEVIGPDELRIGGRDVAVTRRVSLRCPGCRRRVRWFPEKGIDTRANRHAQ